MMEESGFSSNGREQAQFWRELERVEQWLGTGAGAAAGRIYDTMGRPGAQTFANYGNELVAGVARVERVRQAIDQSGPVAKRLAMQQLSGIDLADVWDVLITACKEIALYYGGAVVAGAVVGGAIGSLALGAGAVPGAVAGGAAGSQVGIWVLTLLGLKDLAVGLGTMFPAAMEHYERGFREAWGSVPDSRRDFGIGAAQPSGSSSAGAWHMGQGHVILVTAILTAVVAYLTRGGTSASLAQMARQSRSLGAKFANWAVKNEGRLLAHPQLQSRPNNSAPIAMAEASAPRGRGAAPKTDRVDTGGANSSLPHGFANADEFEKFGSNMREGLERAGYENVEPILQGSAVTGKSFKTGQPFDVGRVSDFDVALADPNLLTRAKELGVGLRSGGTRTGPLSARDLRILGLRDLSNQMGQQAGREVNYMIYNNVTTAVQRAPSVILPGKK